MVQKYTLKGVAAYVEPNGLVRLNILNEEVTQEGLEKLLENPLSASNYPTGVLKYIPPLEKELQPERLSYVQIHYRSAKTPESRQNTNTVKEEGLNKTMPAGYLERSENAMDNKRKRLIERALKACSSP